MRKKTSLFIVFILSLIIALPNAAQRTETPEWWEDGCDPRAFPAIAGSTTTYDFQAACTTYIECDPVGEGDPFCQMQALETLISSAECAPDDKACLTGAMLYAGAILLYDMPFGESFDYAPSQSIQEGFPASLAAFASGDYGAAVASMPVPEEFDAQFMLPFVRGLFLFMNGDTQAALDEFEQVSSLVPELPIVRVARLLVYEEIGEDALAAFEAEWLRLYAELRPETGGLVQSLTAEYPFVAQSASEWLLYGLTTNGAGVGGDYYTDLTLNEPVPVALSPADDIPAALAVNLSQILFNYEGSLLPNAVILEGDVETGLNYSSGSDTGDFMMSVSADISLAPREGADVLFGSESISYFEGFRRDTYLLAPAGAPDPRESLNGLRCGDGAISRLRVGMPVRFNSWMDSPVYFTEPQEAGGNPANNPNGLSTGDDTFVIIGEAQCLGDVVWWPVGVEYDSAVYALGFIAENDGLSYLYNPAQGTGGVVYCPAAPAPRLSAGAEGVVVPDLGANNLRQLPDADSALVTTIPAGAGFSVIDGPTCSGGYLWWRVNYDGNEGWTVEGDMDAYWVAPVLPEVATSAG